MDPAPERVAAAVIRAWIEPGTPGALKIRITTVGDVAGAHQALGVASSIDGACTMIRTWLETFAWDGSEASRDRRRAS